MTLIIKPKMAFLLTQRENGCRKGGWKTTSKSSGLFFFSWSGSLERVFRIRLVFDDPNRSRHKISFSEELSEKDIAHRTLHLKSKRSYLQTVSKLGPWHDHRRFQVTFLPKYGFEKNSSGERRLYKSIKNGARFYRLDETKNNLWNGTEWLFLSRLREIGALVFRDPNTQKTFVEKISGELLEAFFLSPSDLETNKWRKYRAEYFIREKDNKKYKKVSLGNDTDFLLIPIEFYE